MASMVPATSMQHELESTKKRLSRAERLLDIAESENEVLSCQVKTLTTELNNLKRKNSKNQTSSKDAGCQTSASCLLNPGSGTSDDVIIINDDSNHFSDYKPMGFQTEEEIGLSIADSLKETASAAYGFTYDEESGLYYDSTTGVYYNEQTGLYYNPTYRAYYYYDSVKKAYEFYSYATDNDDSSHPTQSSIITTTEKGKQQTIKNQTKSGVNVQETKNAATNGKKTKKMKTDPDAVCTCRKVIKPEVAGNSAGCSTDATAGECDVIVIDEDSSKVTPQIHSAHNDCFEITDQTQTEYSTEIPQNGSTLPQTDPPQPRRTSPDPVDDSLEDEKMDVDVDDDRTLFPAEPRSAKKGVKSTCPIHGVVVTMKSTEVRDEEKEEGELTDTDEDSDSEGYIIEIESVSDDESVIVVADVDNTDEQTSRNAPCIRAIVHESSHIDIGTLFIVTIAGAKLGCDVESDIQIPEPGLSKEKATILWDCDSEHYVICCSGEVDTNSTILLNNKSLTQDSSSEPEILKHSDTIKLGTTTISIHIHQGLDTCDACEPGQVVAWYAKYKQNKTPPQSQGGSRDRVLSREERRKKEMKALKKRYGLQGCKYTQNTAAVKNPKYADKSELRRSTVGSDNPYARDDAPASVAIPISTGNVGHKMLKKMGWSEGEGLGRQKEGIQQPVQVMTQAGSSGLGNKTVQWSGGQVNSRKSIVLEKTRKRFEEVENTEEKTPLKPHWVKSSENNE